MFKPFEQQSIPEIEERSLKLWQEQQVFEQSVSQREGNEPFVFYEGPPTANGRPGIHHVLARTFKDVICRYQAMKGKYVLRKAGWDTHGLPVELQVEKALGLKNKQEIEAYGVAAFNQKCRESVWEYKEEWQRLTARMGYWVDLESPYVTYEPEYIESVWWVLKQIWEKDLIYQAHKVVPYCTRCGTALSMAEVSQGYKEVKETSVYIKFKLTEPKFTNHKEYILSWTTTPWTLPGNVALAVGPTIQYSLIQQNQDEVYIVAEALVDVLKKQGIINPEAAILKTVSGNELVGLAYEPLFAGAIKANEAAYKVYPADFVTTEDGTGVVHTAVMYGEDDYNLGVSVGLPTQHTVDEAGQFVDSVGTDLAGRYVKDKETEDHILAHLKANDSFVAAPAYSHDYPFCWRCGTPLLYYARTSWFVRVTNELRQHVLKNNEQIKWVPGHIKHGRFGNWLEGLRDWAISRERYWGTPLPIWICQADENHRLMVGSYEELRNLADADSRTRLGDAAFDIHKPYIDDITLNCPDCGKTMHRVPEVLDVWFDSGAMPYAQWHYPFANQERFAQQFPADYIAEGIDQTRGWFNSLLILSTILFDQPAYKSAIVGNLILDENGQKMSKSKGNVVDPWSVMNEFGADALRFYMLVVNQPGENKNFSTKAIQDVYRKTVMIWWNVTSFFLTYASVDQWEPGKTGEQTALDRWIISLANKTAARVDDRLADLDTFGAARTLADFIDQLSTWYLRRSRKRRDNGFYQTMHQVLVQTAQVAAPFMPFIAEATYQSLKTNDMPTSVHLTDWPTHGSVDEQLLTDMEIVRSLVTLGHAARVEGKLKVRQPLQTAALRLEDARLSPELHAIIADELNVKEVTVVNDLPTDWLQGGEQGIGIALDPHLTDELKEEGMVRELVRELQELRKRSGCRPGQLVDFQYATESPELVAIIDRNKETLLGEASGRTMTMERGDQQSTIELNGQALSIGLRHVE